MYYVLHVSLLGGSVAVTAAWLWVIVIAFSNKETAWGVISILISPVAILYAITNKDQCKKPMVIFVIGLLLMVFTPLYLSIIV